MRSQNQTPGVKYIQNAAAVACDQKERPHVEATYNVNKKELIFFIYKKKPDFSIYVLLVFRLE